MRETSGIFIKGVFFFIVGATLITLFIWALIQGALLHTNSPQGAALYYFASVMAGAGGLTLYHQAKAALHYARISK